MLLHTCAVILVELCDVLNHDGGFGEASEADQSSIRRFWNDGGAQRATDG
jgi:hypothetical protein